MVSPGTTSEGGERGTRVERRRSYADQALVGPEHMKTHLRIRQIARAIGLVTTLAAVSAHADIYTWVDSSGKLNVSNRQPPEGARITNVYREDPAVRATAETARATAQAEELRALNERVAQLERDLDAANERTAPAPVVYAPPMPAPAPYPSVVAQTIVLPSPPAYGDCADPWGNCFYPGGFGFYPSGVVVLGAPVTRRFDSIHRGHRGHVPPPAKFPLPVGTLPDPVNLFPRVPGR